jgi:small subunit ribosomal protein S9
MKVKTEEYEIGKRHLARMMGENPDNFTQAEVDKAIEYLLPSGLFAKKARPFLKHPEDYYPKSKRKTLIKLSVCSIRFITNNEFHF